MPEDTGWWVWRLLFPARCLGCGRRGHVLCPDCHPSVPYLPAAVCHRCCALSPGGRLCRRCAATPSHLASVRAACVFEGVARRAIHSFKYRGNSSLAPLLAEWLLHALTLRPVEADLLIPVPLSADRLRQRGYNQATLLAQHLSPRLALPVAEDVLVRTRSTTPQVELAARRRRANLHGAFACRTPEAVAGRSILLVDDVTTTGATLRACAEALAQGGPARIMAVAVAKEL